MLRVRLWGNDEIPRIVSFSSIFVTGKYCCMNDDTNSCVVSLSVVYSRIQCNDSSCSVFGQQPVHVSL